MVMAKLAQLGASVWTTAFGHDDPFDFIAHFNGMLSRLQIKAACDLDENVFMIHGALVVDRIGGKQSPVIKAADCDVIIGCHQASGHAYVLRPGRQEPLLALPDAA